VAVSGSGSLPASAQPCQLCHVVCLDGRPCSISRHANHARQPTADPGGSMGPGRRRQGQPPPCLQITHQETSKRHGCAAKNYELGGRHRLPREQVLVAAAMQFLVQYQPPAGGRTQPRPAALPDSKAQACIMMQPLPSSKARPAGREASFHDTGGRWNPVPSWPSPRPQVPAVHFP